MAHRHTSTHVLKYFLCVFFIRFLLESSTVVESRVFISLFRTISALSCLVQPECTSSSGSGRTLSWFDLRSSLPTSRSSPPSLPCWMCSGPSPSTGEIHASCVCVYVLHSRDRPCSTDATDGALFCAPSTQRAKVPLRLAVDIIRWHKKLSYGITE